MSMTGPMRIIEAPEEAFDFDAAKASSDGDTPPGRCHVEGCMNPVGTTPTGRTAKYCDEHKRAANRPGGSSAGPRAKTTRNGSWARAAEIERALNTYIAGISTVIQIVNEEDGKIIAAGGPDVVAALVQLGRDDKKIRRALELAATPGKYGPLVMAILGIAFPIAVNHGLVPTIILRTDKGVN